jgi:pimeloyl-ACP methyl ester carboxylesterase
MQERFDVVAFDPRGAGNSATVRCFSDIAEMTAFTWEYTSTWLAPANPADTAAAVVALEDLARRCGEQNGDLLSHLSTANVAQDLDRLREAVGDEQLNYFGTSYGTYLGQTYANLFPDRIRAMAIDGVINPPSYTSFDYGDGEILGPDTTSFTRILSAEASTVALHEFMEECAAAGAAHCPFAAATAGETMAKFDAIMARLRAEPMVVTGPAGTLRVTYSLVVFTVFSVLYGTPEWPLLAEALQKLDEDDAVGFLTVMPGFVGSPLPSDYVNTKEALWAINCVDTDNPSDPEQYLDMARSAEERNPYFGSLWALYSLPCAFWPAQDEDRYEGPWDAETSATILVISRIFDPATPHGGAILASEGLSNATLLTIDGWGHGYYASGRSTCADEATAAYFINGELPAAGIVCAEDSPPFGV